MPKNIRKTISFKPKASKAKNGLELIFDLERFSKFFNQPDVQDYIPKFLNHIFNSISIVINGGNAYWYNEVELRSISPLLNPIHQKFMGEGGLYIWTPSKESGDFTIDFITQLSNRLWDLKNHFDAVLKSCADDVPVYELPRRIRFGLARGTIYELSHTSSIKKE